MTKTPAELNAEWERIAADLGDGITTAVETAVAEAVREERAAVVAYLRSRTPGYYSSTELAKIFERGEHRPAAVIDDNPTDGFDR